MINVLIAFFITLFIGPLMFLIISRVYYKKEKFTKYPIDAVDFIGDCIFLPFFNALLIYYSILGLIKENSGYVWFCILFAGLVSFYWGFERKNINTINDWSRPKLRVFNFGGWYHFTFFLLQSFLIFVGIFYLFNHILIWFAVAGYLFTVIYHYLIEGPRTIVDILNRKIYK